MKVNHWAELGVFLVGLITMPACLVSLVVGWTLRGVTGGLRNITLGRRPTLNTQ